MDTREFNNETCTSACIWPVFPNSIESLRYVLQGSAFFREFLIFVLCFIQQFLFDVDCFSGTFLKSEECAE